MTKKKALESLKKPGKPTSPADTWFLDRIAQMIAPKNGPSIHMAIKQLLGWKLGDHAIDGESEVRRVRYMWDRSIKSTPNDVSPPEYGVYDAEQSEGEKEFARRAMKFVDSLVASKKTNP